MTHRRDAAIDLLKGVAILLMVFGHIQAPPRATDFVYAFHMPLFMFLSGCTFWYSYKNRAYRKPAAVTGRYLAHRFYALMVPNLCWSVISYTLFGRDVAADLKSGLGAYWFLTTLFGITVLVSLAECITARAVPGGVPAGGNLCLKCCWSACSVWCRWPWPLAPG